MLNWIVNLFKKKEKVEMLDMPEMLNRLIIHEGLVLKPYICPAGKLTIGIGRNVEDNPLTVEERRVVGDDWKHGITKEQAYYLCRNDINKCISELKKNLPWFENLDRERKYALIDMCFQLGIRGLLKFKRTLGSIAKGNYELAAEQVLESKYARVDSPERAKRISILIKTGRWERWVK